MHRAPVVGCTFVIGGVQCLSKVTACHKRREAECTQAGERAAAHRVHRVHRHLVLRCIADEALGVGEADIRGRRAVALVVGDNLDTVILPHADAPAGRETLSVAQAIEIKTRAAQRGECGIAGDLPEQA